jgi:5-methyltetrahydrofolate--homocysteine methyltransferase
MKLQEIAEGVVQGKAQAVARMTREALSAGSAPEAILKDGLIAGMDVVGFRFKKNEIFVPEVLVAARAMKEGMRILEPLLAAAGVRPEGRVLVGTVEGDIHDIGKNLVITMLKGAGLEVIDLGVNVSAARFVSAVRDYGPQVLGMSSLITTTMVQMRQTIDALDRALLRKDICIIVGGAPVTQAFASQIGADGYGADAGAARDRVRELIRLAHER